MFYLVINFNQLTSELYIYVRKNSCNNITSTIAVYVDNILLIDRENEIPKLKGKLKLIFSIKDIGELDFNY